LKLLWHLKTNLLCDKSKSSKSKYFLYIIKYIHEPDSPQNSCLKGLLSINKNEKIRKKILGIAFTWQSYLLEKKGKNLRKGNSMPRFNVVAKRQLPFCPFSPSTIDYISQ
jgi:hypothetical protein